jgi:predicted metalloprotease
MRWRGRRQSQNVEDRRRVSPKSVGIGGGVVGIGLLLLVVVLGGDPRMLLQLFQNQGPPAGQGPGGNAPNGAPGAPGEQDELRDFVAVTLADTEEVWREQFRRMGRQYEEPELVLFSRAVESACGFGSAASGPFYCPADEKVYIDLAFYEELKSRFRAPGDFAQAYVIAHEIGHHVQQQLGIMDRIHAAQQRVSKEEANELSVRLELQADFFAGVWAHHAERNWQILEPGDVEEALRAATAIGDDAIQKQAQGYVVPESFTHGTSEQRVRWFRRGLETGDMEQGDTFSADRL